jgi:flagellar motor switch protein FliN
MADEELLKSEEEENTPQVEEEDVESAESASPDDEETEESVSSDDSDEMVIEDSEEESMDDLVEKQMLEELEKMEQDEGSDEADDPIAELTAMSDDSVADDTENKMDEKDVRKPDFPSFGETTSAESERNLELLMDVNLPIAIELGRTSLKIKDILSLGPGSVVELKKLAGEPVDLLVNNKIVAKGEVVVVDENFGLRITSLLSPEERLRSLE